MFDTSIIEVVIGLIFVFSLLAILVTQINSIITTALNLRARHLKVGLTELVTDSTIRAKILAHPIINMVQTTVVSHAKLSAQQAENIAQVKETTVGWIPETTFVEALIGILISESESDLFTPLQEAVRKLENSAEKSQLRELIGKISTLYSEATLREIYAVAAKLTNQAECDTILQGLASVEDALQTLYLKSEELIPLMDGIGKIQDDKFRNALSTILATARNLDEARTKLESWFNDNMDRVTDQFKRQMQRYSIIVALTVCLVLNIDTLFLARTLWRDESLRATVAAAAGEFQQQPSSSAETGETTPDSEPETVDPEALAAQLRAQSQEAQTTLQALLNLQLPIGWQLTTVTDDMITNSLSLGLQDPSRNTRNIWNFIPGNSDNWLALWLQKIVGIIITTIAASQGAPFWFDLLNRLTKR